MLGETRVGWDTFNFFSNIAENIYEKKLRIGTSNNSYVVTSLVATDYGVNDTWSTSQGRLGQYTGYVGAVLNVCVLGLIASEVTNVHRNCVCVRGHACACAWVDWRT